jgi:uncharacterized protein involved in exopolysaccharide biosynthesis
VKELQRAQDKQKAEILSLKDQRNGLDVLSRDVDSAQRTFDAASQRANEVRLQSQMNQSTVSVLNRAFPPNQPAGPQVLLNATLALIVGLLLGTAVALGTEFLDRRVRSADSLAEGAGLAVLAELPRTRSGKRRGSRKKTVAPEVAAPQPA